jgi:hypothetical protein
MNPQWWCGLHGANGAIYRDTMQGEKKSSQYLTGRVYNLGRKLLVLVPNHIAEGVLNGRVVSVDKVAVDQLPCQTRLACMASQSGTSQISHALAKACPGQHSPTALLPKNGDLPLLVCRHVAARFLGRACRSSAARQY